MSICKMWIITRDYFIDLFVELNELIYVKHLAQGLASGRCTLFLLLGLPGKNQFLAGSKNAGSSDKSERKFLSSLWQRSLWPWCVCPSSHPSSQHRGWLRAGSPKTAAGCWTPACGFLLRPHPILVSSFAYGNWIFRGKKPWKICCQEPSPSRSLPCPALLCPACLAGQAP